MSDAVEEVEEIRKVLRVRGSRKRGRAYFIHAALHVETAPHRPAHTLSDDAGPDCVIDISGPSCASEPTRPRSSGSRLPGRATVLAGTTDAARAETAESPAGKHTPRTFWRGDPAALKALLVLGLDETAGLPDVKKRWRRLAKRLHPDKGGDAEVFIRARTAYETLIGRSPSTER